MSTLTKVAAILLDAGWRGAADAQWSGLESALPELKQALAQPSEQPARRCQHDHKEVQPDGSVRPVDPSECCGIEQPGDVVRDVARAVVNFYWRRPGDETITDGHAVDEIEAVIRPHLAALSPGEPVAWYVESKSPAWFQSCVTDSEREAQRLHEKFPSHPPRPAFLAPPANDEAVRLLDAALADWQEELGAAYGDGKIGLAEYDRCIRKTTEIRALASHPQREQEKGNG